MHALILSLALIGQSDDGPALAAKRLDETTSKLLATIERLEQRIAELERRQSPIERRKLHGLEVDPEATSYEGGTWLHHPQTGLPVFAESIYQRRQGGGGSTIIELVRYKGKPVAFPSVTFGAVPAAPTQPQAEQPRRERPMATLSLPLGE